MAKRHGQNGARQPHGCEAEGSEHVGSLVLSAVFDRFGRACANPVRSWFCGRIGEEVCVRDDGLERDWCRWWQVFYRDAWEDDNGKHC